MKAMFFSRSSFGHFAYHSKASKGKLISNIYFISLLLFVDWPLNSAPFHWVVGSGSGFSTSHDIFTGLREKDTTGFRDCVKNRISPLGFVRDSSCDFVDRTFFVAITDDPRNHTNYHEQKLTANRVLRQSLQPVEFQFQPTRVGRNRVVAL